MADYEYEYEVVDNVLAVDDFDKMSLPDDVLRGIYSYGFERPSPVQQRVIPALCERRDVLAQAMSGTGKTASYVIGILHQLDFAAHMPQALILLPTRELAMGVGQLVKSIGDFCGVVCQTIVGGVAAREDLRALTEKPPHVIAGTPGRLLDITNRNGYNSAQLRLVILDEVDELLLRGFMDQVEHLITVLPQAIQIGMFSRTLEMDVMGLAGKLLHDPVAIRFRRLHQDLAGVRQYRVEVEREEWKLETFKDVLDTVPDLGQVIAFTNTRRKADYFRDQLNAADFTCAVVHGDMTAAERDAALRDFRTGVYRILVTTDLLARGIDFGNASLRVSVDVPFNVELYVHRCHINRRVARRVLMIVFTTGDDREQVAMIERFYNVRIDELPLDPATW